MVKSRLTSTGITQLNYCPNIDGVSTKIDIRNKVDIAIMRIKEFEPTEGYYFADSFGKDSCVTNRLLDMANVKHEAHYYVTGIDPPELMRFGRINHPETIWEKSKRPFWVSFQTEGYPQRLTRWCCDILKEQHGSGRRVVTGIRWQESVGRRKRRLFEVCHNDGTRYFVNPIIDWTAKEVWEFIRINKIPYCSLYDEGFRRLGCVLCPMLTARQVQIQLKRFPKIALAWRLAFDRLWAINRPSNQNFKSADDMWERWLSRKGEPKVNEAQCIMFDN